MTTKLPIRLGYARGLMFKIITSLFFSPSETSKKSYAYHKNPSAIDWVVTTLISTIFKNIPFFHKEANKAKTTKVKKTNSINEEGNEFSSTEEEEEEEEENAFISTHNNSYYTLQSIKNKIKTYIEEANSNATTQDDKLTQAKVPETNLASSEDERESSSTGSSSKDLLTPPTVAEIPAPNDTINQDDKLAQAKVPETNLASSEDERESSSTGSSSKDLLTPPTVAEIPAPNDTINVSFG